MIDYNKKKSDQLGMNASTASGKLVKDLLWNFVVKCGQDACCKCGEKMSRETFSIEHLTPWLDSEDPVGLFFDLDNISFSHLFCNIADARKMKPRIMCPSRQSYSRGCRCDGCKQANAKYMSKYYTKEYRRSR